MNVGDHGIAVRSEAIGLLEAGVQQRDVALWLSLGLRCIKRWWAQVNVVSHWRQRQGLAVRKFSIGSLK